MFFECLVYYSNNAVLFVCFQPPGMMMPGGIGGPCMVPGMYGMRPPYSVMVSTTPPPSARDDARYKNKPSVMWKYAPNIYRKATYKEEKNQPSLEIK